MGFGTSRLETELGEEFPANEHYFGLTNYGNTCYANSVLQALYYCVPFREGLLHYFSEKKRKAQTQNSSKFSLRSFYNADDDDNDNAMILTTLCEHFKRISTESRRTGILTPKKFIAQLKKQNAQFSTYHQQDAHEFLIWLLNALSDNLEKEARSQQLSQSSKSTSPTKTLIHEFFEGVLTNETKCLSCETITCKDEDFLDLSIDVEQNTSITACLQHFSRIEVLKKQNKFYCNQCCSLQEAQKRMKIKRLPRILIVHLKRFKYLEEFGRYKKLTYRVVYPQELRICSNAADAEDQERDREYRLFAVIIHLGIGPNQGHYVTLVKSHHLWLVFDDERVYVCVETKREITINHHRNQSMRTRTDICLCHGSCVIRWTIHSQSPRVN